MPPAAENGTNETKAALPPSAAVVEERDLVGCPAGECFAGKIWRACGSCNGEGIIAAAAPPSTCSRCNGEGQIALRECGLCEGASRVRHALRSLYEADRWCRANDPAWSGVDRDGHRGITLYSQAMWFRLRAAFGRVTRAYGFLVESGINTDPITTLVNHNGATLHLHGFAWGYGGEGPNGLADVLSDAFPGRFPTKEDALAAVARFPFAGSWQVGGEPE